MAEHAQRRTINPSWEDKTTITDFAAVYRQHRLTIYRYILARVGHIQDAQDLTAQVFLKAYQNAPSYRGQSPVIHWLMGIARHQVIDHYRSHNTTVPLSVVDDLPNPAPSLEEALEHQTRMQRVTQALNALSEDRREALAMRLFAGLTNQEIGEMMGKSADAVAMLVYRGVQDLKTRLGEEDTP